MSISSDTVVSPQDIPEVKAFLETAEAYENIKKAYPGVFEELRELSLRYNTLLEKAEKAVREKNISAGPFHIYQTATKYFPEKLYDLLGRDEFLKAGGSITHVPQYDIDKASFDALASQSKIPEDITKQVRVTSPRYKVPEKIYFP